MAVQATVTPLRVRRKIDCGMRDRFAALFDDCLHAKPHRGLMDLVSNAPVPWDGSPDYQPNGAAGELVHVLTQDFCIDPGRTFVRCVLELPMEVKESGSGSGLVEPVRAEFPPLPSNL